MDTIHHRRRKGPPVTDAREIIESDSRRCAGVFEVPVSVKFTDEQHEQLRRIALHLGFTSIPAYIRTLVDEDIAAFHNGPTPAPFRVGA